MKLIDGDIINLTEEDIDNIKKEFSINFNKKTIILDFKMINKN